MTLDVSLSPLAEAKLREKARAAGKELGALASQLLETAVIGAGSSTVTDGNGQTLDHVLAPLIDEARRLRKTPNHPPLKGAARDFAESVASDLRRQGLKS